MKYDCRQIQDFILATVYDAFECLKVLKCAKITEVRRHHSPIERPEAPAVTKPFAWAISFCANSHVMSSGRSDDASGFRGLMKTYRWVEPGYRSLALQPINNEIWRINIISCPCSFPYSFPIPAITWSCSSGLGLGLGLVDMVLVLIWTFCYCFEHCYQIKAILFIMKLQS